MGSTAYESVISRIITLSLRAYAAPISRIALIASAANGAAYVRMVFFIDVFISRRADVCISGGIGSGAGENGGGDGSVESKYQAWRKKINGMDGESA